MIPITSEDRLEKSPLHQATEMNLRNTYQLLPEHPVSGMVVNSTLIKSTALAGHHECEDLSTKPAASCPVRTVNRSCCITSAPSKLQSVDKKHEAQR